MTKLNVKAFAISFGVSWGVAMLLLGWLSVLGFGTSVVTLMSSMYFGFRPGFTGGIIGALWGFIDAGIGGAIIALIYNAVLKK